VSRPAATLRALMGLFTLVAVMLLAARCRAAEPPAVEHLRVRVLAVHPHDPDSFTQGLLWHDGSLYESTGLYGSSRLRRVEPESGGVLQERRLADEFFGEGLARVGDRLIQLTWQNRRGFVYDLRTFEPLSEVVYDTEGWGLCHDGSQLWMSDGSAYLTRRDMDTFADYGRLEVTQDGAPVALLNELECAEGWIYANILESDRIVRIDPSSGRVRATIDASGLLTPTERVAAGVLNGIAYEPRTEVFYVTGKNWPRLFEVVFE
jgi:glutaminyl-peptide cyclotransferase